MRSNPIFALQVRLGPERTKRDNTPHTHLEHELIMCLEGSGWQLAEERRYQCRPGDLFILPAGQGHLAFSGSEEKMHVAVVMVHPETFSGVDDSMRETALILNDLAAEAEKVVTGLIFLLKERTGPETFCWLFLTNVKDPEPDITQ